MPMMCAAVAGKIADTHRTLVESLMQQAHVLTAPPVRNTDDSELARLCLAEGLAKLHARRGARREVAEAIEDLTGLADEGLTWRLSQASAARHRAEKSNLEGAGDMSEDRAALSKHLQDLIDGQIWVKKRS
jgi:DNA primase